MEELPNKEGKYQFIIKEDTKENYFVGRCIAFAGGFDDIDQKVELSDLVAIGSPLEITPKMLSDNGWRDNNYEFTWNKVALTNMPDEANAFMTLFHQFPLRVIQYYRVNVKKE